MGNLDEALVLYRRAFKLDTNVDRAYHRSLNQPAPFTVHAVKDIPPTLPLSPSHGAFLSSGIVPATRGSSGEHATATLTSIVSSFSTEPIVFAPEDEDAAVPLQLLPPELLILILREFAKVCIVCVLSSDSFQPFHSSLVSCVTMLPSRSLQLSIAKRDLYRWNRVFGGDMVTSRELVTLRAEVGVAETLLNDSFGILRFPRKLNSQK